MNDIVIEEQEPQLSLNDNERRSAPFKTTKAISLITKTFSHKICEIYESKKSKASIRCVAAALISLRTSSAAMPFGESIPIPASSRTAHRPSGGYADLGNEPEERKAQI